LNLDLVSEGGSLYNRAVDPAVYCVDPAKAEDLRLKKTEVKKQKT